MICQSLWRLCPRGHLLLSLPDFIHLFLRCPLSQLRSSLLMMFQYLCPSIRQHHHWPCTARTGALSWHPFSNSVLRSNDSMHCPALLDSLAKTGTLFSWSSPAKMMTLRKSLHQTSLQWYQRNASGWGKTPLRTLPRAPLRAPVWSVRQLYWMWQSWSSSSHASKNLSHQWSPKLKTAQ